MKVNELMEGLSKQLYHYTRLGTALKILNDGVFKLSSSIGSNYEDQLGHKDYPYFLSTTRTKFGGYHDPYSDGVMFNLNGNYYASKYKGKPVDYWGDKHKQHEYGRRPESEDRILSKNPEIPADGIEEVHVFIMPMTSHQVEKEYSYLPNQVRQLFLICKKRGIPVFLYNDKKAWFSQDKSKVISIKDSPVFKGFKKPGKTYKRTDYLEPVLELIYKKNRAELSSKADKLLYNIRYYNDTSFENDFFNARKPGNEGYDSLNKIIRFMRSNKVNGIKDLQQYIKTKWENL